MSTNPLEIVLARHGRSEFSVGSWVAGGSLGDLVRRYDEAGITRATGPPPALVALAARSQCVVASDLKRAVESAQVLAAGKEVVVDPGLREARLPDSLGLSVSLPPAVWVVIGQIAWWMNLSTSAETIAATRLRASRAAEALESRAEQHGSVLVVGHGMFNRFIAAHLRQRGWQGPRVMPSAHWSSVSYVRHGSW